MLRQDVTDCLRVFDGQNGEWLAEIIELNKKKGQIRLRENLRSQPDNLGMPLHLYFAPIKKQCQDMVVEKSVELGVTALIPTMTEHTNNGKVRGDKIQSRLIEASQQCERLDIPQLLDETDLYAIVSASDMPILYCAESGMANPIVDVVKTLSSDNKFGHGVAILVGPEGGFTKTELSMLNDCPHAYAVSLGPRILRAETAVIAGLSVIQSLVGDWNNRPPREQLLDASS